jgi:hypothetical protein
MILRPPRTPARGNGDRLGTSPAMLVKAAILTVLPLVSST